MKKELILPGLAVLGGGAGFALRSWQLAAAVDLESGIIQLTHPATLGLVLLSAVLALLFLLLPQKACGPEEAQTIFYYPSSLYMTCMAASGLLLLAAGGLGMVGTLSTYQDLRAAALPDEVVPFPVIELLCGGLCLPAGASVLLFGRANYREAASPYTPCSSLAPGYLALLLLIHYYVGHSSDPLLLRYAWPLLGWVTTLLALYSVSSCCYRKPAPRMTLFFSGAAVYLQLVSLADRPDLFQIISGMALTLYLLAQSAALAKNCLSQQTELQEREP